MVHTPAYIGRAVLSQSTFGDTTERYDKTISTTTAATAILTRVSTRYIGLYITSPATVDTYKQLYRTLSDISGSIATLSYNSNNFIQLATNTAGDAIIHHLTDAARGFSIESPATTTLSPLSDRYLTLAAITPCIAGVSTTSAYFRNLIVTCNVGVSHSRLLIRYIAFSIVEAISALLSSLVAGEQEYYIAPITLSLDVTGSITKELNFSAPII